MSYDQSFPGLGVPQPRINIPINPPMHVQYPSNLPQSNTSNFEDQMRGMILSNGYDQRFHGHQNQSNWGQVPSQRGGKRPNQGQRRQQSSQINGSFQQNQPSPVPEPHLAPHLRGIRAPSQVVNATFEPSNQTRFVPNQASTRPPPQRKQLYNPSSNTVRPNQNSNYQVSNSVADSQAQIGYLDIAARLTVPKVQMDVEEYDEKEHLRIVLERICRKAIFEYETTTKGNYLGADTVELKCFGSMSSTFATKNSDMDLVLVSPLSKPDASAPESEIPRLVEKALLDSGYGVRLLTMTRVPIIRFCEKPTSELRELLLKERAKYQIERDETMLDSEKIGKKVKKAKADGPKPVLPHLRRKDSPGSISQANGSAPTDLPKSEEQTVKEIVGGESVSPASHSNGSDTKKDSVGQEEKSSLSMATERTDPSLLTKSDEERIRLYRLAIQEGWYEPAERRLINTYIQATSRKRITEDDKTTAREPLADLPNVIGRYRPPPEAHPLEFPKKGVGIQCDINFSNQLAIHNSYLLKCYSLCDVRVRPMVLFVKAWSKKRKINNPYHGTLSSYGYVLMVLHYLANIAHPPVLPNLQQTPLAFQDEMSAKVVELDGHNIQFLRNEAVINDLLKRKDVIKNTETVGSLLHGFFFYFAHQGYRSPAGGFAWSLDVLSLRTIGGLLPKQAKGWTGAKTETVELKGAGPQQTKDIRQRYLFAIEDPFEIEHNIARTVVHNGIVAVRDEFRRAQRLIEHAGMACGGEVEDLLAEAEEKENLQYRPFGPRPRNGPDKKANGFSNGGGRGAAGGTPAQGGNAAH